MAAKYKLVGRGFFRDLDLPDRYLLQPEIYRIKALRDIPEIGVHKGQLGGLVTSEDTLSQEGLCWIGYKSAVLGTVRISGDVQIMGQAHIASHIEFFRSLRINGTGFIGDNATIRFEKLGAVDVDGDMNLDAHFAIGGNAEIISVPNIRGSLMMNRNAKITGAHEIDGAVTVADESRIFYGAKVYGESSFRGMSLVCRRATIENSNLNGSAVIGTDEIVKSGVFTNGVMVSGSLENGRVGFRTAKELYVENTCYFPPNSENIGSNIVINNPMNPPPIHLNDAVVNIDYIDATRNPLETKPTTVAFPSAKTKTPEVNSETADALNLLEVIKADISAYETDIVKIVKYPLMTDKTDPFTLELFSSLRSVQRMALNPGHKDFIASVLDLEKKFIAAESNALKINSTFLSIEEKKKTDKARDLLAVASNEASTEQEKKVAFQQAFKQLNGIITVPDIAVDFFRESIGLPELEM